MTGSSPLTRGTQITPCVARPFCRFIPAHAGNTLARASARTSRPVHPRVRGEHNGSYASFALVTGSSPRPRGTLVGFCPRHSLPRFIPASAGNTSRTGRSAGRPPVHPRVRGEHVRVAVALASSAGSSPRPRGTPRSCRRSICPGRFIPAHAGNTEHLRAGRLLAAVHPRSRGEHAAACICAADWRGSSPLTRGTPVFMFVSSTVERFIPAHAGNTLKITN